MSPEIDGFWLPEHIRRQLLGAESEFTSLSFANGRACEPESPGAVSARWPRLDPAEWQELLDLLAASRARVPRGTVYWERMQAALRDVGKRLTDPSDPIRILALNAIPGYTGYSEAMIRFALGALDLFSLSDLPSALDAVPTWQCARAWQPIPGLPGRLRFYPSKPWQRLASGLPGVKERALFSPADPPKLIAGFGAGNVPGTALLIALLAQAITLKGDSAPVTVIKNSRREPIFSALVLSALEQIDPDLVAAIAVLVWDYEETPVQRIVLPHADLVIAAASDETIAQIQAQLVRTGKADRAARFHAHGHKVSFSAIGRQVLERGLRDPQSGAPLLEVLALLAGLDSLFWDQHGCLSSRIHFIENGGNEAYDAQAYAQRLSAQLRELAIHLPRGAWPRQQLHDRFDRYKALETTGRVQVFSSYDDEFVLIMDQRELGTAEFFRQVNECQGRVIVVRPVHDLMEIPEGYLRLLPAQNLQSLSVALGGPGEPLSERDLKFVEACGRRGVTAIRCIGRGAFPQLAYSWDGLIPADLIYRRPHGYFTTIEFDRPYEQILETYHMLFSRAGGLA